jgi:hypothetical protein
MRKVLIVLAGFAAMATLPAFAFAHPIHDGTSCAAILAGHNGQTPGILALKIEPLVAQSAVSIPAMASNEKGFEKKGSAPTAMAAITSEVIHPRIFPTVAAGSIIVAANRFERENIPSGGSYATAQMVSSLIAAG